MQACSKTPWLAASGLRIRIVGRIEVRIEVGSGNGKVFLCFRSIDGYCGPFGCIKRKQCILPLEKQRIFNPRQPFPFLPLFRTGSLEPVFVSAFFRVFFAGPGSSSLKLHDCLLNTIEKQSAFLIISAFTKQRFEFDFDFVQVPGRLCALPGKFAQKLTPELFAVVPVAGRPSGRLHKDQQKKQKYYEKKQKHVQHGSAPLPLRASSKTLPSSPLLLTSP